MASPLAIPAAAWGDATGVLVRFAVNVPAGYALGRLAIAWDAQRRHDLVWLYRLRGRITRLESERPETREECALQQMLHAEWRAAPGPLGELPPAFTGNVRVVLWDVEVPLQDLPDGPATWPHRDNALLPCRVDPGRPAIAVLPYPPALRDRRHEQFLAAISARGVRLHAALLMANSALYAPGADPLPAGVLMTFHPHIPDPAAFLGPLAQRAGALGKTLPVRTPEERFVYEVRAEGERRAVYHRRVLLPLGFTGGTPVFYGDLWLHRPYLPGGTVRGCTRLPVLAEPFEGGGQELLPPG